MAVEKDVIVIVVVDGGGGGGGGGHFPRKKAIDDLKSLFLSFLQLIPCISEMSTNSLPGQRFPAVMGSLTCVGL